ncbi:carbohydrate kinase family protein [Pelagicoccus sp. SDUM812002]|uniref:carbohydrate kinase family protein n=1 Tax=Pelagicoccus sp. SDUM812002 TaxID=3041266 RepID=UPI0028107DF4|nr:carbohydrate kinase family protein [Pelagicoccus sp. SDUM812002]MDQ8185275.1 carbohydrate kinase family protein [Pelagicoccus sp. SDUM812002]
MRELQKLTAVELLCVRRGKDGAMLLRNGEVFSGKGEAVKVADTIGAGDFFTAALTMGLLEGRTTKACLKRALALSTFVAGKSGAQPEYTAAEVLG